MPIYDAIAASSIETLPIFEAEMSISSAIFPV
jgi:hypothetical protein